VRWWWWRFVLVVKWGRRIFVGEPQGWISREGCISSFRGWWEQ
jgi:hypothetical protein